MSLKAIAKQLGISVTTVSRALNGYDDVSQETRARVEAEAQRRGYRPNTFARRLKMGTIVPLVSSSLSAPRRSTITFFSRWSGRSAMSWRAMTLICC